jgi:ribosomal protein S18 acetylase RimI-like enzyme
MNADVDAGASQPPVTIRPYQPSDDEALVDLWQVCGLTRPWNDPRCDIERKRRVQPELFLVAVQDDVLVGSVMGGYDGHRGWAYYLAVSPECHKQGIARRLMRTLETALEALGCPKFNLMVRNSNTAARGFYKRLGYARDDVVTLSKRLIPDDHRIP